MTATHPLPNLGTQQSPIALESTIDADLQVSIDWEALVLRPNPDGYSPPRKLLAHASKKSGVLRMDRERYVPIDFHWHFPSEHVLGARHKAFPAEVHIVHVHQDDLPLAQQGKLDWCRIVVVGVMLRRGKESYEPMDVAAGAAGESVRGTKIARDAILPEGRRAIRYRGSLTTPPYSENVTFVILEEPMTATKAQLDPDGLPNARALQACNRRFCLRGEAHSR